jgi:hypothetical protein
MNMYGALPQPHWGQWWSTKDASLAELTSMTAPNVFAQEEPRYNYTYSHETFTKRDSPVISTHTYPVPSPTTDPTSLDIPVGDIESRRCSSFRQGKVQAKLHQVNRLQADQKRISKGIKQETAPEKPKDRGSKVKAASQPAGQSFPQSDGALNKCNKKIQERNRVASNKFRIKKREEAKNLVANKGDIEQINRKLLISISDLTQQVHELKMKLLQHTDCNCYLIQEYIAHEATRYIHDLGDNRKLQTTTPHPRHHYQ